VRPRWPVYAVAEKWAADNERVTLAEAFIAGYVFATSGPAIEPAAATPVEALAPEGKPRRTLAAALALFLDQILRQQPEEITSGEWCSVEEAEALLEQLRREDAGCPTTCA